MAFIDWIKEKVAAKQQPAPQAQQKPETAKEMYTRESAQDAAQRTPVAQMPESEKAKARELGETINNSSQPKPQNDNVKSETREGATSPQPMRQTMAQNDNHAPALSPTSAQRGSPEPPTGAPSPEKQQPAPKQAKAPKAFTQSRPWYRGR